MKLKRIPEFSAYCISKDGKVWSLKHKRFLELSLRCGYFYANLNKNSKVHQKRVHRLVLETFVGPCPENMECCHNNGTKTDNRLENLRWDTRSNNIKDAVKHGTLVSLHQNGETNPAMKLKEKDVRMIVYIYRTGLLLQREIAKIYNVSRSCIAAIVIKRSWKHIWNC